MRRFATEQNFLLILSLVISVALWSYVSATRNPRVEVTTTRTVAVIPYIIGDPASGYSVAGVRVTPPTMTISGDPRRLAQIETVSTEPVNISGATREVVQVVTPLAPAGVRASRRVRVTVQVIPAVAVTIVRGIRVHVFNPPPGLIAEVEPDKIQVQVQGPVSLVTRLRAEDFLAQVDGLELTEGRRRVRIVVQAPPQVEVLDISPPAVVVIVRKGG